MLRRAADAPQRIEALSELATLMGRFNAPEIREPSDPSTDEGMKQPLLRLADIYRKVVIEFVMRTESPAQVDRSADQSHDTHDGPEQESGGESTAGDGGEP